MWYRTKKFAGLEKCRHRNLHQGEYAHHMLQSWHPAIKPNSILFCCVIIRFSQILLTLASSINYTQAMQAAKVPTLYERRSNLCERLFSKMLSPNHKLNSLVPTYNLNNYNLRHLRSFQIPVCRTDRFDKSFLPSAVRFYDAKF